MTTEERDSTTLAGSLAELIRYYSKIQDELKRLQDSKEIAKNTLLERFKVAKLREYVVDNLQAAVTTSIRKSISVKEAEALLPPDLFGKLLRETTSVILTVRRVSKIEEQDYDT